MSYDPTTSLVTTDATIGAVTYIVTDFSDNGAAAVGPDFQESDGSYRGCRKTSGAREGSMTIEIEAASQAIPAQFATFTYMGNIWLILTVSKKASSTAAGTFSLSLRWTAVAA